MDCLLDVVAALYVCMYFLFLFSFTLTLSVRLCTLFLPFNFFTLKTRDCLRVVYTFHALNHWIKFAFVARVLLFSIPYEKFYMRWLSPPLVFSVVAIVALHCTALHLCVCVSVLFLSRSTFCLSLFFFRLIRFAVSSLLLCIRFVVVFSFSLSRFLLLFIHTDQFRISFTLLHISFMLFALYSKQ